MIKNTAKKLTITLGLLLALVICGTATAAPEPTPEIAGTKVSYETNPASHDITYSGTNSAGTYTMVITQIRNDQKMVDKGQYEVRRGKGVWVLTHKSNTGNVSFEFVITKVTENGFQAKGNVFDQNGHPALHGPAPYDFNFVKVAPATR